MSVVANSALGDAKPGAPNLAHWSGAIMAAVVVHGAAAYTILKPLPEDPPPPVEEIGQEIGISLAPPAPVGGVLPDPVPPPPEPEPEPEVEPEPEPEPDIIKERAEDAPPPKPLETRAPKVQPKPTARPSSVRPPDGGGGQTGYGADGSLSLAEFRLIQDYLREARRVYMSEVRYPFEARRQSLQGRGVLHVTVNRRGRVQAWQVREAIGSAMLDREIERVAKRVRRLPRLPEAFSRDLLVINVPIHFLMVEKLEGPNVR
ncbi:MAG: energy transducer TonB [Maricaulaceae bacterium]